ncbi:MAG: hypothetical protein LBH44_07540 [Treponema sp.]|jgi:hypothetical protein|nr:hypothetical protein [Treponema sp.]
MSEESILRFTERLKEWALCVISQLSNQQNNDAPCFDCIKRGGICKPECEKRRKQNEHNQR